MSWLRCVAAALLASVSCLTGSSRAEQSVTSGRYLLSQRTVVKADIPILPDISTETWTVSLLELEASSSSLRGGGKVCHIEMSSSTNLVRMELPVAFQRLVSDVELEARLTERAGRIELEESPRWRVLGAKLRDSEREPLPQRASDPRVIDQDGDGQPGVTVRVRGIVNGEVFVVQRGVTRLRGLSTADGFAGAVVFHTEDVVIGASKPALLRRTATRPDSDRSTFVLRKVPARTDCATAVSLARQAHR